VDYIRASAFNHCEFAALLEEVESEYKKGKAIPLQAWTGP
jgi:hypothetical protein